jgi:hypothetical protein
MENLIIEKEKYVAPEMEIIEVVIEKGFACSPGGHDHDHGWDNDRW